MFLVKSKTITIKTFKISEVEIFLQKNKITYCQYNNQEYSIQDFLWLILKLNGNFKLHLELHRKFFGDFTLKKYLNGKKSQKF